MKKQLSERELIELQIQAYEFYAGLIDRAVGGGTQDARLPRWDEQRALEYRQLAEQLRQRLAELEAEGPMADAPAVVPVPTSSSATPAETAETEAAAVSDPTTAKTS